MGFFDAIQQVLGESMQSGGPTVSCPDSYYFYYSQVSGEIRQDDDYMREFTKALLEILQKRPNDTYLQSLGHCCGAVSAELWKPFSIKSHGAIWRVYYGEKYDRDHSFLLKFMTPNAIQRGRNGEELKVGNYRLELGYAKKQAKIAQQRKELAVLPHLESFLGVKFGDDAANYVDQDSKSWKDMEDGSIMVEDAKINHLLDFVHYGLLVSTFNRKVVGIICGVSKDIVGDTQAYRKRIAGLLTQKYGRKFFNTEDGVILPFYDVEKWNPDNPAEGVIAEIELSGGSEGVILSARDTILFDEMTRSYEEAEKIKARQDKEAKREERRRADMEALDAL